MLTIKRGWPLAALVAMLALPLSTVRAEAPADNTVADGEIDKQKLGYAFGYQMATNLQYQGMDKVVETASFIAAIEDVLSGNPIRLSEDEMKAVVEAYRNQVQAKLEELAARNKVASDTFLSANAKKEGVETTESGLQYRMLEAGQGPRPTEQSTVVVHYTGTLIDGTKFDSSRDRGEPVTFPVNGVIPGWQEGLALMQAGSKYELYVPPQLAYGVNAPPEIGPNQVLIFDVELLEVK